MLHNADTEEGAEQDALFYKKRRIGQGEGRDSGRSRPRKRVKSGGIGIKAETLDIGESSPGGAKSVKERCFLPTPLKGLVAPEEFKSVTKESLHHISSRDSSNPAIKAM